MIVGYARVSTLADRVGSIPTAPTTLTTYWFFRLFIFQSDAMVQHDGTQQRAINAVV